MAVLVVLATVAFHVARTAFAEQDAAVAPHCLEAWNGEVNRDARVRLNGYIGLLVGTPRIEGRLTALRKGCRLVLVTASGTAVIWRLRGEIWAQRRVEPVHSDYRLAGWALVSPNVVTCYGARLGVAAGALRERDEPCVPR